MSSFFRPLLGDYAAKLQIPPVFVCRFPSLTPKTVTIFCSSERSWDVDIEEENNNELYFKRGWNTFVEDNALGEAEFIVFKFDGNSTFKAKIYATSYLRRDASTSMSASSFFKILHGENMTTKFRIPLLFVSRYSTVLPKTVTFIRASSSNRSWKVDIEEEDDKRLYFKNGWKSFVEDNSLKISYLLVFKFDGHSTFKVDIFGTSACERELEDQPCNNQSYCIQHFYVTTTQDRLETQEEFDPINVVDQQKSNLNAETPIERMDLDQDNSNQEIEAPHKEVEEQSYDDHQDNSNQEIEASHKEVEEQSYDDHQDHSNQEIEAPHKEVEEQSYDSHGPIRKTAGNNYEGPMYDESSDEGANLSSKKNPTFKIYLQQAYAEKGVMCFPTEFFQKYMKNKRQELEIETVEGVWTVTLLPHMKRTRTFARLSKGWSEFAKANHFKTGETLVFKLVRRGDHPKFLVDRQC